MKILFMGLAIGLFPLAASASSYDRHDNHYDHRPTYRDSIRYEPPSCDRYERRYEERYERRYYDRHDRYRDHQPRYDGHHYRDTYRRYDRCYR